LSQPGFYGLKVFVLNARIFNGTGNCASGAEARREYRETKGGNLPPSLECGDERKDATVQISSTRPTLSEHECRHPQ